MTLIRVQESHISAEDVREDEDPLQSLIAEILEAENRGEAVDRDALIVEHQEHADSLREFFSSHDQIKSAADLDPPTLPPRAGVQASEDPNIARRPSRLDDPTLPPSTSEIDDPTLPPTEGASETGEPTVGDKVRYFGDYELIEEIARGGMGVVYKARQTNLNRIVALKMILAGQFAGEEDVQRFYTEAEAAASLDHPGIVPIFEIGEHAGQHYFSMGYIEGESLAQKVAEGPLPPREAAEMVKKICDAMAYAHERGVIHRDLKPANILIDSNGQPKVTDFGLAKKTEADSGLTGTGQILGTPAYMPPEQASGKTDVGPLADVYSLGAILYCLLTGRPPFQAASPMDTLLQVLDQEPIHPRRLNSKIPQDLESVTLKCLQKVATKRYAGCQELSKDLHRFLSGEPTEARPVGSIRYAWNWCWAHVGKVAGGLTLASCAYYATTYCVVMINGLIIYRGELFAFWVTNVLIPSFLILLTVLIAGSKLGILTLSGHRLSLVGSTLILGLLAYDHIRLSLYKTLLTFVDFGFAKYYSDDPFTVSVPSIVLWYLLCVVTQVLAMLKRDRTGNLLTWSEDVARLRKNLPSICRGLAVSLVGGVVVWHNGKETYMGTTTYSPDAVIPGLMLVTSGVLIMLRSAGPSRSHLL